MAFNNSWLCVNESCGKNLGTVNGGEFSPAEDVPATNIATRGANLTVKCPHCGTVKTWYTSDPVVRATNQLIDVMSEAIAKRAIHTVNVKMTK